MKDETCASCVHHDTMRYLEGCGRCRCGPPTPGSGALGVFPIMPGNTKACGQWFSSVSEMEQLRDMLQAAIDKKKAQEEKDEPT